jgi:small-conductance mechanosensitive channel
MSADLNHIERLQHEVSDLMEPLRQHYAEAEREIEELQQRLNDVRKTRDNIRKLVRVLDPSFAAKSYSKNGGKKTEGPRVGKYSEEKINEMRDWLQANADELNQLNDGDGFYGSQLANQYADSIPLNNQSAVASVMIDLRERGVIRLSKLGSKGGRKYYKVVV